MRTRLKNLLNNMFRRSAIEQDLRDELGSYINELTERKVRRGLAPDEARRQALVELGGTTVTTEAVRAERIGWALESCLRDLSCACRVFRNAPGFVALVVLTLALGIGATVTIFSAVNAVVLRDLPWPDSDRLVAVTEENVEKGWHRHVASTANYLDWRDGVPAFQSMTAYEDGTGLETLTLRDEVRTVRSQLVDGDFFATLGVYAEHGRTLSHEETWDNTPRTAVLSHAAWKREFGGDTSIVGRTIVLGDQPIEVVGIMPAGFAFPRGDIDVWRSFHWNPNVRSKELYRRERWLRVIARLAPGDSIGTAHAQLQRVTAALTSSYPSTNAQTDASIAPLHEFLTGGARRPLLVLLAAVTLLLFIACANVGNLTLVRSIGRRREVSLRLALGAGRHRIVRQAVAESLMLSSIGGIVGLALGWVGTRALTAMLPQDLLPVTSIPVDGVVVAFAAVVMIGTGLLFGLGPALWAGTRDPAEALSDGSRGGTASGPAMRWLDRLVIGEVALALLLTTGAGLLARSFWQFMRVDPGFDSRGLVAISISLNRGAGFYTSKDAVLSFHDELLARARSIPGVTHAALASSLPLTGTAYRGDFIAAGRPADGYGTELYQYYVSPDYFAAMGIALRRGRLLTTDDRAGSTPVIVINERLATSYFQGQDPIGQRIVFAKQSGAATTWYSIVGVVADQHETALDQAPRIAAFTSTNQYPLTGMYLLVRTPVDALATVTAIRTALHEIDPRVPIRSVRTLDELVARSTARPRFFMVLLAIFATVGISLSVVGVYGAAAQLARHRTREMGIRIALGARGAQIQRRVVVHGLRLSLSGLLIGEIVALVAMRVIQGLLFRVTANDPITLVSAAALLVVASVVAAWVPAFRVSRVDPLCALRAD